MFIHNQLILRGTVLHEQQTASQARSSPHFMEPEVSLRIYKRLPSAPILSQINPIHAPRTIPCISVLVLSCTLPLGLPSGLFPTLFSPKHIAFIYRPICE
jgi:hypothetical protein